MWNAETGKLILMYQEGSFNTNDVSWSPDGRYIASAHGNTVHIWNTILGNRIYTYQGHALSVNAVAWSPDGTRVASASSDETVQIWQAV